MVGKVLGSKWLVSAGSLALVGTLIVAGFVAQQAATPTRSYCADLHDAVGVFAGNTVTRRGVGVGTISEVETVGQTARVTFTVEADQKLPADIKAATVSPSIIAVRQLALLGDYTGGTTLHPGQCIPIDRTSTPVSISKSLESVGKVGRELTIDGGPGQLASVLSSVNTVGNELAGTGPVLNAMIKQLAVAPRTPITGALGDMATVIDNVSALSGGIVSNGGLFRNLVTELTPLLESTIVPLAQEASDVAVALPDTINVLADLMTRYQKFAWPALDAVVPIARLVGAGMRNFGDVLGLVPVLIRSFDIAFDQQSLGLRISYSPPKTQIPAKNPELTCASVNRIFPGQCHVVDRQHMEIDALRLALVLSGAAR